jgi:hypothetical protein
MTRNKKWAGVLGWDTGPDHGPEGMGRALAASGFAPPV